MKVKRLVSLMLIMALLVCSLAVTAFASDGETGYAGGSGTATEPYLISNATQLNYFRDQVNSGAYIKDTDKENYKATYIYVKLTDDIDLNGEAWTPIGNGSNTFRGTFDGDGHIVSNFKLTTPASNLCVGTNAAYTSEYKTSREISTNDVYGFFATVDGANVSDSLVNGTVKKLGLENVTIAASCSGDASKAAFAGALVGYASAQCAISECYVKNVSADIDKYTSGVSFGAIMGRADNLCKEINACYAAGIKLTIGSGCAGNLFVGLLTARADKATFKNCYTADADIVNNSSATCNTSNTVMLKKSNYSQEKVYSSLSYNTGNVWDNAGFSNAKVDAVSEDNLKNLTNITFDNNSNGKALFVKNNSGGYPKLYWESNPVAYELSCTQSANGTLSVSKSLAEANEAVTVTATPNEDCSVKKIMANGTAIWEGSSASAVNVDYTPTASTTFTAIFGKDVSSSLGRYLDPYTVGPFSSLTSASTKGNGNNYNNLPENYKVTNKDGYFALTTGTGKKDVTNLGIYNKQYSSQFRMKSTIEFAAKVTNTAESAFADGDIASFGLAYAYTGNYAAKDTGSKLALKLVKSGDKYSWKLYKGGNEIGDATADAALDKWYSVKYDSDASLGQLRVTVTDEDGKATVIQSTSTGIVLSYANAIMYLKGDGYGNSGNSKITAEETRKGVSKIGEFALAGFFVDFKKEAEVDMKEYKVTEEKCWYADDVKVALNEGKITASTDMYIDRPVFSGTWEAVTPPIYIAVYNNNKELCKVAVGQIKEGAELGKSNSMLYAPEAVLDASKLSNGTYTVKVMLWSEDQVPYKPVTEKTLTVSDGSYTLN